MLKRIVPALLQIFREVAEQMALDHPNIVSTFGVSHEPGSGSLLLVSAMAVRGNLYDLLHNSTYDPDTATTVGLIADVSSGTPPALVDLCVNFLCEFVYPVLSR